MKTILSLLFLLTIQLVYGQSWDWVNYLSGGNASHYFFDLTVSSDQKSIYGVGRYRSFATFYGQDSNIVDPYFAGNRDAFLVKMDLDGNYDWVITEGGTNTDYGVGVTTDEYNNVYMIGYSTGTAYFENEEIISNNSTSSVYVAKYNPLGELIWVKNWEGDGNDNGINIECNQNGSIFISGYQDGNFDFDIGVLPNKGFFIGKLDYDGNFIWCKGPENNNVIYSKSSALEIYNDELYIGGAFRGQVDFGSQSISNSSSWYNMYFAKLDTNGVFEWARRANGTTYSNCEDIAILDSSIYVVGTYAGTMLFDTITLVSQQLNAGSGGANESKDAFLAKYNFDGSSCLWIQEQKSLSADINYGVTINNQKNIIVAGGYLENNSTSQTISEGDTRITEYDQSGNINWQNIPNGDRLSKSVAITTDINGNIYGTGYMKGSQNFGPNTLVNAPATHYSGYIGKMYPPLITNDTTLNICTSDSILLSLPNINGSVLSYTWYSNNSIQAENNDSLYLDILNVDSVWCITSNPYESDTSTIYINSNSFSFDLGDDTTVCDFSSDIIIDAPSGYQTYNWSTGESSSTISVNQTGNYVLNISNSFGCTQSDSIVVNFVDCTNLKGNDISDIRVTKTQDGVYKIITNDLDFTIVIYNMNGQQVNKIFNNKNIDLTNHSRGVYILNYSGRSNIKLKIVN